MINAQIPAGTIHSALPPDMQKALVADRTALAVWQGITPLARNEFICWVENAKHIETRARRVRRTVEELNEGKRRPCCWMGCPHRTDKAVSPSVQWVMSRKVKK